MTSPKPSNIVPLPEPKSPARWAKCRYGNMRRYIPSDMIYANAKVRGRVVSDCLNTTSETIAKVKLDKLLTKERAKKKASGDMAMGVLLDEYLVRIEANPDLKPMSKRYRRETVKIVRDVWAGIDGLQPQKIALEDVSSFASTLRGKYSATRFNGTLETLRLVFQLGIELGVVAENPVVFTNKKKGVKGINRAKIVPKNWQLPSPSGFNKLVARLDALPSRLRASRTVRFLAYSGLRIGAAQKVMPSDVDLTNPKRGFLSKPPIKYTDTPMRLPMFKELRKVCQELLADYPGSGPLLPIKNPRKALKHACIECGLQPLTNHALRHLFTTRCLESGVDVKTVAEWRGDKDGGSMLLRIYAHLTDDHSRAMANRVKF